LQKLEVETAEHAVVAHFPFWQRAAPYFFAEPAHEQQTGAQSE
jgi:hypothetical protein